MTNKLQQYFPMIRTRQEVVDVIANDPNLQATFDSWEEEQQTEFLDFCTGARGVKLLYDSFFKEVINPDLHPDRLEDLLSTFIDKKVKIVQILPNESSSIPHDQSLLIMDIKTVYTLVFFEKSTQEFKQIKERYIHWGKVAFDTGLNLKIPQEYILIPLDIYKKNMQNKAIRSRKEAWLGFLSMDKPDRIVEIIEKYPKFRGMYEEVYEICRNIEGVMEMFSKELREMDQNTVKYMIEEQQEQIDRLQENSRLKDEELRRKEKELQKLRALLAEKESVK